MGFRADCRSGCQQRADDYYDEVELQIDGKDYATAVGRTILSVIGLIALKRLFA